MTYTGFRLTGRNAVLLRPEDRAQAVAGQTWARDRSNATADDGTEIDATWINRVRANLEGLVTALGGDLTDGDDQLANAVVAYVAAEIDALVAGSPGALDTLNELAAALGDDAGFAATMTNALALKAPLASPTFTGTPAGPTAAPGTNTTQIASTAFVAAAVAAVPGLSDGDKGDIVVSASGLTWTVDDDAITTDKILDANVTTAKIADANVTSAKLAAGAALANIDATLSRLSPLCVTVTDWNDAASSGWYQASDGTNAPIAATWYFGYVIAHNASWIEQVLTQFTGNGPRYRRFKNNGTWTAWVLLIDTECSAAEYRSGVADKLIAPDVAWAAAVLVSLTDAGTIAVDMATFINATVTLGGNRTLGNPTNVKAGQSGVILIKQDGTGSRTLAYSSYWKFPGGTAPTLTTTASRTDKLFFYAESATVIHAELVKDSR